MHVTDVSHRNVSDPVASIPPLEHAPVVFDHTATFGIRDLNEFSHDRRIGAAGEAYVSSSQTFHFLNHSHSELTQTGL